MEKVNILGVNIIKSSRQEVLKKIEVFLNGNGQHQIVTPNPEIILTAVGQDDELFYILNKADLALPDGVGLKMAGWFMGINLSRATGADLVKNILELSLKQNRRVAVFNWSEGLSSDQDIKQVLMKKYPKLQAMAVDLVRGADAPKNILAQACEFMPDIIFSTFGAPYQEKFIFHNLPNLPTVKLGLGVGGAFDFLTGKLPRAPLWLRNIGLEWLWRLIKQPKRWRRIYNAVVVFPLKFLFWRFKKIA